MGWVVQDGKLQIDDARFKLEKRGRGLEAGVIIITRTDTVMGINNS